MAGLKRAADYFVSPDDASSPAKEDNTVAESSSKLDSDS